MTSETQVTMTSPERLKLFWAFAEVIMPWLGKKPTTQRRKEARRLAELAVQTVERERRIQ